MRVAAAVLLLASAGSAQILFSLQRLGAPRGLLPVPAGSLLQSKPPTGSCGRRNYKKQVEQRNNECYKQCATEFPTATGSAAACERGCRLFALGEASKPKLSADEHRDKCTKDCATAYPVPVEQHSCESGCRHQRPKQQDKDGAPVVMSVVRKYSFESEDGRQVQRSQSSVLVNDGDQMKVINGPARVVVSQREPVADDMAAPSVLDAMLERMRQTVQHMILQLSGPQEEPQEQEQERQAVAEQRIKEAEQRLRDRLTQDRLRMIATVDAESDESDWHRALRNTPPYAVLGALLLGTGLVLYTCYCLIVVARRRRSRRQEMRQQLIQHEEMAEDLPPKYLPAVIPAETIKSPEAKEAPPAYRTITAAGDELPPKLDV